MVLEAVTVAVAVIVDVDAAEVVPLLAPPLRSGTLQLIAAKAGIGMLVKL